MRIEPTNVNTPAPLPAQLEGGSKVTAGKVTVREGDTAQATTAFSPTADLSKLLELVRQVPDVRADVVQDVTTRTAIGELATRTAATDTAAALLGATAGE
jgi:hypothetical protein